MLDRVDALSDSKPETREAVIVTRSPEATTRIMAAIKQSGTRPEMLLRRELHRRGLRYRVKSKLIGKPDLVFASARVACFVDGDRWHGNGWRLRGLESFEAEFAHANAEFWKRKILRNIERDRLVDRRLKADGWLVMRVWASAVEQDVVRAANDVESVVRSEQKKSHR